MENSIGNISPKGFEFTVTNNQVTGMELVLGTHTFNLPLPSKATFTIGANSVTETWSGSKATEVIQFVTDSTDNNLYHLASDTVTFTNPTTTYVNGLINAYSFTIASGKVTGMQSVWGKADHTHTQNIKFSPTSTFSVNGDMVTETLIQGNTIETLQFVKTGTDGLFAIASDATSFVQPGSAQTLLFVDPTDRVKFTLNGTNVTSLQDVRLDGSLGSVKSLPINNAHNTITFTQLGSGYIQETITNGTRSMYEVYHDGNHDGIYTAVAHGTGTTVDLVGLKAQISSTIDAVT